MDHSTLSSHGASKPSSSMSPKSTEASDSNIDPLSQPPQLQKRSSSVRFLDEEPRRASSMSNQRHSTETDEITPIRNADGNANRSYRTTESENNNENGNNLKPSTTPDGASNTQEHQSWLKKLADKYGSITLENKGSVARDHLALERTFLAWLRTSLAFASIGIAITQLFRLNTSIQTRDGNTTALPIQSQLLPLSPLLGHGLSPELIPLLQQLADAASRSVQPSAPRNTLLDQLLFIPTIPSGSLVHPEAFDDHAAAKLRRAGKPLGATFIGISIVVLLIGFHRYFESQYWVIRGKFPASRGSISFIGLIAGALMVASLVVVLVVAPVSYQKP